MFKRVFFLILSIGLSFSFIVIYKNSSKKDLVYPKGEIISYNDYLKSKGIDVVDTNKEEKKATISINDKTENNYMEEVYKAPENNEVKNIDNKTEINKEKDENNNIKDVEKKKDNEIVNIESDKINVSNNPDKDIEDNQIIDNNTQEGINLLSEIPKKYSTNIKHDSENEILRLVNEKRKENGLQILEIDGTLVEVARYKSEHMLQYDYFEHVTPMGEKWSVWLKKIGYNYFVTAENIAYNSNDPNKLFEQWWNSQGHKENMLNESFTKIGIGIVYSEEVGRYMGTQIFA